MIGMSDIVVLLSNPPSPCFCALIISYIVNIVCCNLVSNKYIGILLGIIFGTSVYLYLESPGNVPWELNWNPMIVLIIYGIVISLTGVLLKDFKKIID